MDSVYEKHYDPMPVDLDPETDILKVHEDISREPSGILMEDVKENIESQMQEEEYMEELSPGGVLDEETISRGLSNLGRSAHGDHQVYLNVTIPGFSLTDVTLLGEYEYLQKVEIPYNDITDLSPLGKLHNLIILDASHNKIEKLLDFTPPFNLQEVNLSWNNISEMANLSSHRCLIKLDLSNNSISEISGLSQCMRLKYLSMAHNKISQIVGLDGLPIQYLNLSNNLIRMKESLENLKYLRELDLSGNIIRSLSGLQSNARLEFVDLEDNEVIDVADVDYLKHAKGLRELNLLRNPIQELPDYRLSVLHRLSCLTTLDRRPVKEDEKVAAVNMFDPPLDVVAARDHIMHVVYSFLQPSRVWDSTLPNVETPYPMLVLVGPQGSGKKDLAMKLVDEFGEYFGYGISHTTRRPRPDEISGKDYYFVSLEKFEMDIKMGQFVQTHQYNGNWYGLQMESIENVAREGLASVVHMELEGVLTLKKTYFEPRYVLVLPLNPEIHERRLHKRGFYTEDQINKSLKRVDVYVKQNQEHPGFFDMMICTDDLAAAYVQLRKIVMDYLGITGEVKREQQALNETREITPTNIRGRTWSKPSNSESQAQVRSAMNDVGSALVRGIVEEESIKRRQSAAKDVITGYVPPLYDQLMSRYPRTAPQATDKQDGLGQPVQSRAFSAPTYQNQEGKDLSEQGPPMSPDSSVDDESSSNLSDLDSATELHHGQNEDADLNYSRFLPTETLNPIFLMEDLSPRPPSAGRSEFKTHVQRPGSERHSVLPPIQPTAA
ncbi:unnamed protein product [Lymnaea stagnalis]|uniref:Guanylate kinase-like domain-containing protein n=1 Tax=Lymnaea stagnalis TaxID=6523 RepID=A0AAV2GZX5_LYMST